MRLVHAHPIALAMHVSAMQTILRPCHLILCDDHAVNRLLRHMNTSVEKRQRCRRIQRFPFQRSWSHQISQATWFVSTVDHEGGTSSPVRRRSTIHCEFMQRERSDPIFACASHRQSHLPVELLVLAFTSPIASTGRRRRVVHINTHQCHQAFPECTDQQFVVVRPN